MKYPIVVEDQGLAAKKNLIWWLYFAHFICLVLSLGALCVMPLIVNYLKREETRGTFLYGHHRWQIRAFWWYCIWWVLGGIFYLTVIGIPLAVLVWFIAWVWKAYRLIRGIMDLNHNQAMPI